MSASDCNGVVRYLDGRRFALRWVEDSRDGDPNDAGRQLANRERQRSLNDVECAGESEAYRHHGGTGGATSKWRVTAHASARLRASFPQPFGPSPIRDSMDIAKA